MCNSMFLKVMFNDIYLSGLQIKNSLLSYNNYNNVFINVHCPLSNKPNQKNKKVVIQYTVYITHVALIIIIIIMFY